MNCKKREFATGVEFLIISRGGSTGIAVLDMEAKAGAGGAKIAQKQCASRLGYWN
jgi:hypothetical protein